MKAIVFSLLLLMGGASAYGQITLDSTDLAGFGTNFLTAYDTLAAGGENEGAAGTGQSWDLSTLTTHRIDTTSVVDPASTPYSGDYPTSNYCIQSSTGWLYFENKATSIQAIGAVGDPLGLGQNTTLDLNPPTVYLPFPYAFGTNYLDTTGLDVTVDASGFGVPLVDSGRYKSISYREVEVDGEGTLILGQATYSALREREVTRTVDSIWTYSSLFGWTLFQNSDETDSSFRWIDPTQGYFLASVEYGSDGLIDQIGYLGPNPVVSVDPDQDAQVRVYPNPAGNWLTVEAGQNPASELVLTDLSGKKVAHFMLQNGNNSLPINSLKPGFYVYLIRNAAGTQIGSGKLFHY